MQDPRLPGAHYGVSSGELLLLVRPEDRSRPRFTQYRQPPRRPGDTPHGPASLLRPYRKLRIEAILHRPVPGNANHPCVKGHSAGAEEVHPGSPDPAALVGRSKRRLPPVPDLPQVAPAEYAHERPAAPTQHFIRQALDVVRWVGQVIVHGEVDALPLLCEPQLALRALVYTALHDAAVKITEEPGHFGVPVEVYRQFIHLVPQGSYCFFEGAAR